MKTKVSGPNSLELALEMRKKKKMDNLHFFQKQKVLVQAYLIVSMDVLGLDR